MNNKLECVVSLGILGFGIWIIAATRAASTLFPLWIALGMLTIAVGLFSLLAEVRMSARGIRPTRQRLAASLRRGKSHGDAG